MAALADLAGAGRIRPHFYLDAGVLQRRPDQFQQLMFLRDQQALQSHAGTAPTAARKLHHSGHAGNALPTMVGKRIAGPKVTKVAAPRWPHHPLK
jgi:hypothetical protein